jgi:hypothetical protein
MAKWADWLISAVRYDDDHSRIVKVRAHLDKGDTVGSAQEQTRAEVVRSVEGGQTYCTIVKGTDGKWKRGEDVRVITIDGEKFIRTDANRTKKDNLGNLPEF